MEKDISYKLVDYSDTIIVKNERREISILLKKRQNPELNT